MFKQVLILRKDLNMRKGKMIAQGAHAAIGALKQVSAADVKEWERDGCTKICVSVADEKELLDLTQRVADARLPCYLVIDAGRTEFHGEKTFTALGIGPALAEDIDKFTGTLSLL
jgi:peptidyl-tRNA hydrolase, PTH2 family